MEILKRNLMRKVENAGILNQFIPKHLPLAILCHHHSSEPDLSLWHFWEVPGACASKWSDPF